MRNPTLYLLAISLLRLFVLAAFGFFGPLSLLGRDTLSFLGVCVRLCVFFFFGCVCLCVFVCLFVSVFLSLCVRVCVYLLPSLSSTHSLASIDPVSFKS